MGLEDYKKEYITNQFKKTFGKKYENYCISRIYHLLQRNDIQFVTQQILRRDNNKRAMADLYFPQINVWVEIDEDHHIDQRDEDKQRTEQVINNKIKHLEEIVSITALEEPQRIEIPNKSLLEINKRIDEIVDSIKKKIQIQENNGTFIPWNGAIEDAMYFVDRGYIETKDNAQFRTTQMVSKLFNKGYKEGSRKTWFNTNEENANVWCPKLSLDEGDFDYLKWNNTISMDGTIITEIAKNNNEEFYMDAINNPLGPEIRFVFPYYKCTDGLYAYKFRGVFKLDIECTKKRKARTWIRISDKLDLRKFFD